MKYVINATSHEHMLELIQKNIDVVVIGEELFSLRLPYTYQLSELADAIQTIQQAGKAVYLDMHTMITAELLTKVEPIVNILKAHPVEGVLFSDPGLFLVLREQLPEQKLIYAAEATTTNWYTANFWLQKGVKTTVLAKELTKKAIKSIDHHLENTDITLEVQVFGPLTMFHSRRNLLDNYYKELQQVNETNNQQYLFDAERNNYYPIFEDASGTHILSPNDVCVINELDYLADLSHVQWLKIDCLYHEREFMNQVIDAFISARELLENNPTAYKEQKNDLMAEIIALYTTEYRKCDRGFFYKPTIY